MLKEKCNPILNFLYMKNFRREFQIHLFWRRVASEQISNLVSHINLRAEEYRWHGGTYLSSLCKLTGISDFLFFVNPSNIVERRGAELPWCFSTKISFNCWLLMEKVSSNYDISSIPSLTRSIFAFNHTETPWIWMMTKGKQDDNFPWWISNNQRGW